MELLPMSKKDEVLERLKAKKCSKRKVPKHWD